MGLNLLLDQLTMLDVNVGPVIQESADLHKFMYNAEIAGFTLPTWMFKKLSQEDGFMLAGSKWMGRYNGYTIFCQSRSIRPMMAERGGRFVWRVL